MTPHPSALGEFGRIDRFFRPLARGFPGALSLTDDAAIVTVPSGKQLVLTTDAIVAGVHFFPSDAPDDIARKALRVNLSDLAAKGACPMAYTLTLATGPDVGDVWVEAFAAGLADDQALYGIHLAGGDSVSTSGPVWVSITAFGLVDAGRMVTRGGARPGDMVMVTGTIGDAALGLAVAQGTLKADEADCSALLDRYRLPQPRTELASTIGEHAHAALDISDGLAADFDHLCRASNVLGLIEAASIPLSPAARRAVAADSGRLNDILGGGDDYEVLLTASSEAVATLRNAAAAAGIGLTVVGRIAAAEGAGRALIADEQGNPLAVDRAGWTHS